MNTSLDRRRFLATSAAATLLSVALPRVHAQSQTDAKLVIGDGDYRYSVQHNWPQLPDQYSWQTTHNVAVDKAGNLYVIHEGRANLTDHPSIFVFDPQGKFVRAFGKEFQGGGHGLEVRQEGNEEFLYVTGYQQLKTFAKMTLKRGNDLAQLCPHGVRGLCRE